MFAIVNEENLICQVRRNDKYMNHKHISPLLSPLMSSNMVDTNIVDPEVSSRNVYMYKSMAEIPHLVM